jgi:hypothetical protein
LGRYGPQLLHDEAAQREHFKEVDEDLSRDQEADRIAKGRSTRPRWGIGYLVVLLGVAGFVLSCFLPYTAFPGVGEGPSLRTLSYYRLVTFIPGGGTAHYVGELRAPDGLISPSHTNAGDVLDGSGATHRGPLWNTCSAPSARS